MEYAIGALLFIGGILAFNEISILKKRIESLEKRLNQLAKNTGNDRLSSYWVSDEIKENAIHLKRIGKEVEAVKIIRDNTEMSLLEAKQYVDELS